MNIFHFLNDDSAHSPSQLSLFCKLLKWALWLNSIPDKPSNHSQYGWLFPVSSSPKAIASFSPWCWSTVSFSYSMSIKTWEVFITFHMKPLKVPFQHKVDLLILWIWTITHFQPWNRYLTMMHNVHHFLVPIQAVASPLLYPIQNFHVFYRNAWVLLDSCIGFHMHWIYKLLCLCQEPCPS